MATTVLQIENDGKDDLRLFLEPEGAEFRLAPKKSVEVHVFGTVNPVLFRQSVDDRGRCCISLWPAQGTYKAYYEGEDVWNCLRPLAP